MESEEIARTKVECSGNEHVQMNVWTHKLDRLIQERIRVVTQEMGISINVGQRG